MLYIRRQSAKRSDTQDASVDAERMDWEGTSQHPQALGEERTTRDAIVPADEVEANRRSLEVVHPWEDFRAALPTLVAATAVGLTAFAILRSRRGRQVTDRVLSATREWADRLSRISVGLEAMLHRLDERESHRGSGAAY